MVRVITNVVANRLHPHYEELLVVEEVIVHLMESNFLMGANLANECNVIPLRNIEEYREYFKGNTRCFRKLVREDGITDNHIYFGGADVHSLLDSRVLHKELDSAIDITGGLQQSSQGMPEDQEHIEKLKKRRETLVRDIAYALTGKEIDFIEENNDKAN